MKTSERAEAKLLRAEEGRSVREIAALVGVSRSTVSLWVRDIELTPEQHASLHARNPAYNGQLLGQRVRSARAREQRLRWQEEGRALARRGDPCHVAGCMLFWAEGDKTRTAVRISNSDPDLLRYFIDFLRRFYIDDDSRFRISCHLFADHVERQGEVERYWLRALGLPQSCLRQSYVNVYSRRSQKKRQNKLPYGTCKLALHSTQVAQSIFGAIQEYGGFTNERWVDQLHGAAPPARS
jgi:transposase-like protein